ncbi:hypothetical protein P691DRAFT_769518 [Macrolepiota fuliginosa MF-IS2]|uniref:Uncharacterized protein n=1 Tax=Macrolepiota fuliginosa MF-IS2 TaxID=1400762 RepID=A0A9P5WXK3_9AGAR|nr:hypothetical protein P691DRAFT_769518 [Macrolepiota fuliginosa MF-IS2]
MTSSFKKKYQKLVGFLIEHHEDGLKASQHRKNHVDDHLQVLTVYLQEVTGYNPSVDSLDADEEEDDELDCSSEEEDNDEDEASDDDSEEDDADELE